MKQALKAEVNKFTKGIITEANELLFPANASLLEENFILTPKGFRKRRLGLQYEPGGIASSSQPLNARINASYLWKAPNGDTSRTFRVISFYKTLYIYDNDVYPLSSGLVATVDVSSIGDITNSFWRGGLSVSMTSVDGRLFVVIGAKNVGVISYNGSTFSLETQRLLVRDLWGAEDSPELEADPSIRPTTLSDAHYYNLQNQSWGVPRKGALTFLQDPVDIFRTEYPTEYPNNSESVWVGLQYTPVAAGADPYEKVFPKFFKEAFNGGIPAARGYYIIDLLDRGASREAQFLANKAKYPAEIILKTSIDLPADQTNKGATLVKAYSSRVFYAGFPEGNVESDKRSPTLNNYLVFSQAIKKKDDAFKCYQEGDPTSRENAEVVDTDGGFIKVAETNIIRSLEVFRESLIIFGDNGIWALSGGGDYGFTASNYKLGKLSDTVCASPDSIVVVGSDILFWALDGIYSITKNQFGDTVVNSISQTTIQTLYNQIPKESLYSAIGCYSGKDKTVRWLYSDGLNKYELCLNTTYSAFTRNKFYGLSDERVLSSVFVKDGFSNPTYLLVEDFYSEAVLVGKRFKFGELSSEAFLDFTIDAKAFLQTGHETTGDTSSQKQAPYLLVHFVRTESGVDLDGVPLKQSSCLAQARWGWSLLDVSNKWSRLFQAYRERKPLFTEDTFESGFLVVTSKNKLRGRGRAFSLYFETEAGKDCQLLGWNLTLNGNQFT